MTEFRYVGRELELLAKVGNWKRYWSERIAPFLSGDVAEVGAGIGSNLAFWDLRETGRWVCVEPDPTLIAQLERNLRAAKDGRRYEVFAGTLRSLPQEERFDTILYIDVLEHIEADGGELAHAAARLRPGGRIIVLAPAHAMLYSPFDRALGHFRRYDRAMLRSISPAGLNVEAMFYLDCMGLLLSAGNLLLRQAMPTRRQLQFWDRWMIPISRVLDRCLFYSLGKTVVGVWRAG